MRTWIALVAGCMAGLFSMTQGAGAVSLQSVGNFIEPVYMTSPPGDPRLFVVERGGRIQVVQDGTTSQFLDIHDRTTTVGDRGMLSMAFDPDYARTGLFYVFYTGTAAADGQEGLGHVDEFHVSSNPNVADAATRRPVLTISRPNAMDDLNGGQLQFGRDGYLYISVGDADNHDATAQNLALLNGKLLRIDPHGATPGAYSIPPDNPFASSGSARHEIWASGLRNPWRFSFDAGTGDLTIGDVGAGSWRRSTWRQRPPSDAAPTSAGRPARAPPAAAQGRPLRSSRTRTTTLVATSRMAARSSAATSTADPIPALAGRYLHRSLRRRAPLDQARHPVRGRRSRRKRAGRSQCSVVVGPGRELQSLRHRWPQCGGQARRPAILRHSGLSGQPEQPDQVQEEAQEEAPRGRGEEAQEARRRSARRRSTRRRERGSSRVISRSGPCLSTDERRATKPA